jgi:hypothetical protein
MVSTKVVNQLLLILIMGLALGLLLNGILIQSLSRLFVFDPLTLSIAVGFLLLFAGQFLKHLAKN